MPMVLDGIFEEEPPSAAVDELPAPAELLQAVRPAAASAAITDKAFF